MAINTYTVTSEDVAAGGLALVYAYRVTGDNRYLEGAKKAALCLRRLQAGNVRTINYSSTASAGGTARKVGYWTHSFAWDPTGGGPS